MRRIGLATALFAAAACRADAPVELQPDLVLRSELGLTDRDAVHVVRVRARGALEVAEPSRVRIEPGHWVSFEGGDARGHRVRFDTAATLAEGVHWLRDTDQMASPPLLSLESRWVVSFLDAPEGDYPFVVEGGGTEGAGQVEVRRGGVP